MAVGTGGHDWHSPEYVREWVAEKEAEAAERAVQFDLLADYVPHGGGARIRTLDVGAGWGPVTSHLLGRFPRAEATLLDYSPAMLDEARARLGAPGDRLRYVVGDLTRPGALAAAAAAAGGGFDAVVSVCCFHNIEPAERVAELYREVRGVVRPGGCFLNLDSVGTDGPILRPVSHRARVERRRRRLADGGRMPSFEEVDAEVSGWQDNHLPSHRSVAVHLAWLQEAGFDVAECFWRQGGTALVGGYVAPARSASSSVA